MIKLLYKWYSKYKRNKQIDQKIRNNFLSITSPLDDDHCELCGKLLEDCPHCGNWYCPDCDDGDDNSPDSWDMPPYIPNRDLINV